MTAIQQFGPIRFIQGDKNGRYPFCHSIYIEEVGVLIDPSANRDYFVQLKQDQSVETIWLSHWHEDHFMHLDLFADLPLWMHKNDAPPLADIETFIDWYGIDRRDYPDLVNGWRDMLTSVFHYSPRTPTRYLEDGEIIDLGGVTVEIIHCPGHSPGSLAFFFREPEILFLGDTDLTPFGPWYGDRYSDIDLIIQSVNRLRQVPARKWLTSHEQGVFDQAPAQIWDQYLNVIQQREDKLMAILNQPKTLEEIAASWIVYGKPKKPVAEYILMEAISMKKHADRLVAANLLTVEDGYYCKTG